jgi:protein-L-isoaspartate(D-aspartate) O-methyltransferase
VIAGDGSAGQPGEAPFDAIMLSGSVASVPQRLLDQLKVGGKLMAVVGSEPVMRATLVTRHGEREWASRELFDTIAPRLLGFDEPTRFTF